MRLVLLVALGCALASCEMDHRSRGQSAPVDRRDVANDVAMLAAGRPSTAAELDTLARASFSGDALRAYARQLLSTAGAAELAERVLHLDIGGQRPTKTMARLHQTSAGGETIYYLHTACTRSDAVEVKPWWDLATTVLVCRDSYRPDVFGDATGALCTGHFLSPLAATSPCGCGPNLIRCGRDEVQLAQVQSALIAEHRGSIAYVVSHDLPIQTIFSSNESFRSGLAELVYQRGRIESREVASLEQLPPWSALPARGAWAPRHETRPGQHAGIATNNFFTQAADSVRLKMVDLSGALWCDLVHSTDVHTDALLARTFHAAAVNFRSEAVSNELAAQPLCTNCHARLDYGAAFFNGMRWSHLATHYDPRRQLDTPGPLYLMDIDDGRGSDKRNPAGFMRLALDQPEYAACIAQNLATHVFGKPGQGELALLAELEAMVKRRASYRALLSRTLDAYISEQVGETAPRPAPASDLVATVDTYCTSCHDEEDARAPGVFAKQQERWCSSDPERCPDVALAMLVSVANERMPKGGGLAPSQRRAMIEALAPYAWPDPSQRAAAVPFFLAQAVGGAPIHRSEAMLEAIRTVAPDAKPEALVPVSTLQTFGPSLAATLAVAAARACSEDADRTACIRRALAAPRILK